MVTPFCKKCDLVLEEGLKITTCPNCGETLRALELEEIVPAFKTLGKSLLEAFTGLAEALHRAASEMGRQEYAEQYRYAQKKARHRRRYWRMMARGKQK